MMRFVFSAFLFGVAVLAEDTTRCSGPNDADAASNDAAHMKLRTCKKNQKASESVMLQMHRDTTMSTSVNPCLTCSTCVADPNPSQGWPTTDGNCAACSNGGQTWWPCNTNTPLCECGGVNPTPLPPTPTPAPSPPPVTPSPLPPDCGKCANDGNCLFGNGVCHAMSNENSCKQWLANVWCGESQSIPPTPMPAPPTPPTPTQPPPTPPMPTPLPTPTPTPPPSTPTPTPPTESKKIIAFLENWKACPSDAQIANYDEVMVSFAVTYTWAATKNVCDPKCDLKPFAICNNGADWDKVRTWQAAGTKVLVSLGGAGMGGSWVGAVNDCWDYCLDKVDHLVSQVKQLVVGNNLDGVDVDYEYHTDSLVYQEFLKDLTIKLKQEMPDKVLTHTPLDWHLDENDGYYNVLKEVGQHIDLLMPQYYNGYIQPTVQGVEMGLVPHYSKLVHEVYGGDARRILHGFCVNDCSTFNVDGQQALQNFKKLQESFPDAGGVFFWAASEDLGNSWSKYLLAELHGEADPIDNRDSGGTPSPTACSGGCCQCAAGGSCYVGNWGSPCFVPQGGQADCAQFNGEWCG